MHDDPFVQRLSGHGLKVTRGEPMKRHTTWRIGGPADYFVEPDSVEALRAAVCAAREHGLPITVIGRGSNMLVLDGGIRGLVIKLHDAFAAYEVEERECAVRAMAGRSYVALANIAIRHGLSGLEFATGIPGSVGGAVMMNAGAYGRETCEVLEWAEVMDEKGEIQRLSNRDLHFGYRHSVLKERFGIVTWAKFQLQPGDRDEMRRVVRAWSQRRIATQPLSFPNCGSVFRNPEGTHAAKLIEAAGLKGLRRGQAMISDKHANFIINLGNARASDVLWLIRHAQAVVRERFGISLETEVRVLGEPVGGADDGHLAH
ncbi:UDP-N-acetylmuramate dehydrogenase [Alicyclobacillus fructus]|uniref:UDP-N-acetylmuramate dehydrogenase n=1 Tax=Alicyclobacillus fructus TaxID=2816082 RepID=UPI001A8C6C89|nr:UDP-N-acetylmuramate dehydrogenase [Alicyclobacillus fructus]